MHLLALFFETAFSTLYLKFSQNFALSFFLSLSNLFLFSPIYAVFRSAWQHRRSGSSLKYLMRTRFPLFFKHCSLHPECRCPKKGGTPFEKRRLTRYNANPIPAECAERHLLNAETLNMDKNKCQMQGHVTKMEKSFLIHQCISGTSLLYTFP